MNILYITTDFDKIGSSAAVRNASLVNGLLNIGNNVDILTIEYPQEQISTMFSKCPYRKIFRSKIKLATIVQNTSKVQNKINNSIFKNIKRFVRNLLFFPDIYIQWKSHIPNIDISNYDVIISSSDSKSSHFVAEKIKKNFSGIRWIQIWGDPWSIDSTLDKLSRIRAKYKEKCILYSADKVIYISELTAQAMKKMYPKIENKINYIPRSYYCSIENIEDRSKKDILDIIYPGNLYYGRTCKELLEDISIYNKTNDIQFRVKFYGNYLNNEKEFLKKFDFVEIHRTVSYENLLDVFKKSDALLFISNNANSTQIPGKLFDYMGTNLPIICIVSENKKLNSFLSQYKKCLIYKNNFENLADKIRFEKYNIETQFNSEAIAAAVLA